MLNDSNVISCTVPVFAGNEAAPFPGIRERKMTGIPGRPGNGRPGMKTLLATHGPKHASNLTHVISRDKFQPCHRLLLEYFAFIALHALHCMLLEIALNTGSVVLEGTVGGVVASCRHAAHLVTPCVGRTHCMLAHFMVHRHIAVVCK